METKEWSSGFCSCSSECLPCVAACLAPVCLQGLTIFRLKNNFGGGSSICIALCLPVFSLALNRKIIRERRGIEGNFCVDCLLYSMCCCVCMVSQEYREIVQHKPT